jgi:uncharacterized membrane protein YjjP (DUF1212 family)
MPGSPAVRPVSDLEAPELDELREFLLSLGSALTAAGSAVNEIEDRLRVVAAAYGAPAARIVVVPTFVVLSLEPGREATLEPIQQLDGPLRLDQTAAVFEVLRDAMRGGLAPAEGIARLRTIETQRPRFGIPVTIAGHVILTVGICLVLQSTAGDLVVAGAFGAMVAVLKLAGARWRSVQMVTPVLAAFVVSALTFVLADHGWVEADLRAMIAPLVTFLPGGQLTVAVVELAAAELVTGASRLVAGSLQLFLLAFGIVAATQVVDVPSGQDLVNTPENLLGWWAPWLGVLVFGVGAFLYFSAPRHSLRWLLVVLFAAWIGQKIGSELVGGYLSGFVGGLVLTIVAYWVERRPSGPPALVTFLPGFWLLVPGALGLIGVTEYIDANAVAGVDDFLGAIGAIVAIALGVLCAYPIDRSMHTIAAVAGRRSA